MTPFDNGDPPRYATAVRRLTRWLWHGLAVVALVFFLAVLNNNYSLRHPSRTAINEQLDHALNDSVNWIKGHPADAETSPPLMYMVADMERMSHDPRLRAILEDYQKNYLPHPVALIDFVWYRLVIRNADVPVIQVPDQNGRMNETAWDAYAVAPDKISLAANDRATCFPLPSTSGAHGSINSWRWSSTATTTALRPSWIAHSTISLRKSLATNVMTSGSPIPIFSALPLCWARDGPI